MSKGTPMRYFRAPDDLWAQVQEQAAQQGTNVSDLIRGLLREWLLANKDKQGDVNE